METPNETNSNPLFSQAALDEEIHRNRIAGFRDKFFKSYGGDMLDWYDQYFSPKIKEKKLTTEEYSKLVNEDEYFKLINTLNLNRRIKKIHFWILFWSILYIISAIACGIYFGLIYESHSYLY